MATRAPALERFSLQWTVINSACGGHEPGERPAEESGTTRARDLLQRCQAGDEEAWRELFAERARQIYRWARWLGLLPADAEDAAQEVLATAVRRIKTCRAPEVMTSWLYGITRKTVANHRRKGWWRRFLSVSSERLSAESAESSPETSRRQEVSQCLRRLSFTLAETLLLMDHQGLTREEVARLLGVSPGTVASRLRLAREAFRREWNSEGRGPALELSWRQP